MKTNQLTLIAISIFVALIIFIVFIYLINLISESPQFQGYLRGGPIDFDPDLSPIPRSIILFNFSKTNSNVF